MSTERLGLIIPPLNTPGPDYATQVNAALTAIDDAQPFNLKSFGGECNNSTDDTEAWQRAFDRPIHDDNQCRVYPADQHLPGGSPDE